MRTTIHHRVAITTLAASALLLCTSAWCDPEEAPLDIGAGDGTPGVMMEDIVLRPGVTVDLFVNVYGDTSEIETVEDLSDCQYAIHGGVFAAASWRPYAEALGEGRCVIAPDMPVRGNSGEPEGLLFGELDLFDYVTAHIAILDRLAAADVEPETILGHSMGGTLLMMIQQRLVDEGTELEARYDIKEAILVASDLPAEVPWALGDSGDLSGLIEDFAVEEPAYGTLFEIPVELWPAFYFTDLNGDVVPNGLSPQEIEAGGFNALGEPLLAIQQLNGTGPYSARPSAAAGLFSDEIRLRAIAYEQDIYVQLGESETLYQHLTGDASSDCFVPVLGPDTAHVLQFSNPQALVDAIDGSEDCDY